MSLRDRVPIAMTEDGSDYNGPLSTYPEWHAATIGVGLGIALVLGLALNAVPLPIVGAAVARPILYAHTGRRIEIAGRKVDMPTKYLRQIRSEPHYLDGGVALTLMSYITMTVIA